MFGFKKFIYKSDSERIARLKEIVNIDTPYTPYWNDDKYENKKKNMLSEIQAIEESVEKSTSEFFYCLDIAYRNYCAWFIRGDDRIPFLKKQNELLNKSVQLDSNNYVALAELMDILINHVQIRDLPKSLEIAKLLKDANQFPDYLESSLKKAKKWSGIFEIPETVDFTDLVPSPANFREEHSYILKAYREWDKNKDERIKFAAKRLYNLAILAGKLYGGSFTGDSVTGAKYDKAMEKHDKIAPKINFDYQGRISDSEFLSEADYKKIEKVFGKKEKNVSLRQFKV